MTKCSKESRIVSRQFSARGHPSSFGEHEQKYHEHKYVSCGKMDLEMRLPSITRFSESDLPSPGLVASLGASIVLASSVLSINLLLQTSVTNGLRYLILD